MTNPTLPIYKPRKKISAYRPQCAIMTAIESVDGALIVTVDVAGEEVELAFDDPDDLLLARLEVAGGVNSYILITDSFTTACAGDKFDAMYEVVE